MVQKLQRTQPAAHDPADRFHALLKEALGGKNDPVFWDVGAYRGDFTADFLRSFPDARGILFEPTPTCHAELEARYRGNDKIRVVPLALSNAPQTADYYVTDLPYNNSLLTPTQGDATTIQVDVESIDNLRSRWSEPINFVKIDAQGHDLQILKGAIRTIAQDQPCVLVEAIFIDLYERQDSYHDILQFMTGQGYHLAAVYSAHSTENGILAYADWLFLPAGLQRNLSQKRDRYILQDPEPLRRHNQVLQKACDERLALIHRLTAQRALSKRTLMTRLKHRVKAILQMQR